MATRLDCSMKEIERKLRTGDPITDAELKQAVSFYEKLADMLLQLGSEWHFAFGEANRLFLLCRSYQNARKW